MPYPFNIYFDQLASFDESLREILNNKARTRENIIGLIRLIYSFNLSLKKQKSEMLFLGIEHAIKIDMMLEKGVFSQDQVKKTERASLLEKYVQNHGGFINKKHFLATFMPGKKAQAYFAGVNQKLQVLAELIRLGKFEEMAEYLEGVKT